MKRWILPLLLGLGASLGVILLPWLRWLQDLRRPANPGDVVVPRIQCAESTNLTVGVAFRFPIQVEPEGAHLSVGGLTQGWALESNPTSITGVVTNPGEYRLFLVACQGAGSATRTVIFHVTPSEGPKTNVGGLLSSVEVNAEGPHEFEFIVDPGPRLDPGPGPEPPRTNMPPVGQRSVDVLVSMALERGTSLAGQHAIQSAVGTAVRDQVLSSLLQDGRFDAGAAADTNAYELRLVFSRLDVTFRHQVGNEAFGDGVLYMLHCAYACQWQWTKRGGTFRQPAMPGTLQGECSPTMFQLRTIKKKKGGVNEPIQDAHRLDWALRQGKFADPQFWGRLLEQVSSSAKAVPLP